MTQQQLPAYLQKLAGKSLVAAGLAGIGLGQPPRISIKGNTFTAVDASGNEMPISQHDAKLGALYMECIIVDVGLGVSKQYYAGAYDPKATEYEAPTCWSNDGRAPDSSILQPQAQRCMGCPRDAWGSEISKVSGKEVKACTDGKKIAVLLKDGTGPYMFRLPPNSLKQWSQYMTYLGQHNMEPQCLVTRIRFISQGTVAFDAMDYLSETMAEWVTELDESDTAKLVGNVTIAPRIAAPQQSPGLVQQAPAAAPAQPLRFTPPTAPQVAPPAPQSSFEAPQRRRRTKAEMEAARAPQPEPAMTAKQAEAHTAKPLFGQVQPERVEDDALSNAIADALGLDV